MNKMITILSVALLEILLLLALPVHPASANSKFHSGVPRFTRGYWSSKNLHHYNHYRKYAVSKDTFAIDGIDMEGVNYSYLKKTNKSAGYTLGTIMYRGFKKVSDNKYRIYAKKQSPINYADSADITVVGHNKIKIKLFKKGHPHFGGSKFTLYKIHQHAYNQLARKD